MPRSMRSLKYDSKEPRTSIALSFGRHWETSPQRSIDIVQLPERPRAAYLRLVTNQFVDESIGTTIEFSSGEWPQLDRFTASDKGIVE